MPRTITHQLRFDRLLQKGDDAFTVVKLMMACNDMSLANQALADWKATTAKDRKDRKIAAGMYFVRLELSHLYEAVDLISAIEKTPSLRALVDRRDVRTRDSYAAVLAHAPGGTERKRFERLAGMMRNNLTFHYAESNKLIAEAMTDRASRADGNLSAMTRADTIHRWRFNIADDVVDSIVVRNFWQIPRDADLREEADKIVDEIQAVLVRFADFSGEFIWKFCAD